jgi:small subunit ribosomal protein S6
MESTTHTYEAMFLMDAGLGTFEAAAKPVETLLERAKATVLALKPWDERRLCYEIQGRKRGLYLLVYFAMDTANAAELETDCQLNDQVLRMILLRRDEVSDEELRAETPAQVSGTTGTRSEEDSEDRDDSGSAASRPVESTGGSVEATEESAEASQSDVADSDADTTSRTAGEEAESAPQHQAEESAEAKETT